MTKTSIIALVFGCLGATAACFGTLALAEDKTPPAACSDPAQFAKNGLSSLAECRTGGRDQEADGYRVMLCLDAKDIGQHEDGLTRSAFQNHCRELDAKLKMLASRPDDAVKFAGAMAVSQAWSCLSVEATSNGWARDGFMGTMMSDAAYKEFAAPRLDGTIIKQPCRGLLDRGVMQSATISGEELRMDRSGERPRWHYSAVAGASLFGGDIKGWQDSAGQVRIEAEGRFEPNIANDANPLGAFMEKWSETAVPKAPVSKPGRK